MDSSGRHNSAQASARARRIEEAVLELDGVAGVRVWDLAERVEIGVRVAPGDTVAAVLQRVTELAESLRGPEEQWDVGVLTG